MLVYMAPPSSQLSTWVSTPLLSSKPPRDEKPVTLRSSLGRTVPRESHSLGCVGPYSQQSYLPGPGPSGFRWRCMPFLERRTR